MCGCGADNCSGFLGVRPKVAQMFHSFKLNVVICLILNFWVNLNIEIKKKEKRIGLNLVQCINNTVKVHFLFTCQTAAAVEAEKRAKEAKENKDKNIKKRKRRRPKADSKKEHDDDCFRCGLGGELVMCDKQGCSKVYHLKCLKLDKPPFG